MIRRTFILKQDLFKVKKGRIFHTTYDGEIVYPYFTDEEFLYDSENVFPYKFLIEDVEKRTEWFEEITERSDFVKQISGQYKFMLPKDLHFSNISQEIELTKNGILYGHVTNVDLETGEGTIEILPEYAEIIWKEIAGPYVSCSSSNVVKPDELDEIVEDLFKIDENPSKESKPIELGDENEDLGGFFSPFDIVGDSPPKEAKIELKDPFNPTPQELKDVEDFFNIDDLDLI